MSGVFDVKSLTMDQFNTVYNFLSFGLAAMIATTFFLYLSQQRVLPRYRQAVVISGTVTLIAAYHYWRMFDSFEAAHGGGDPFNEAYRYVDWLLTVPLLLVETVAVLALAKEMRRSLLNRLVPASAAMIALGYPGDIAADTNTKMIWFVLSMIPFLYILYILFVELTKAISNQSGAVTKLVRQLRTILILTWAVYPISYLMPVLGFDGSDAFVGRQIGYTIADVTAKCLFGLMIYQIARTKSAEDSKDHAWDEAH